MTIQEAIKTGKPFRRPIWTVTDWIMIKNDGALVWDDGGYVSAFWEADLIAEDWETKSEATNSPNAVA